MAKTNWMQHSGEILPLLERFPLTDPGQSERHKRRLFTLSHDAAATSNPAGAAGAMTVGLKGPLQTPDPQHSTPAPVCCGWRQRKSQHRDSNLQGDGKVLK